MRPPLRTLLIASIVLLLHAGGLWALQSGLLRRAVEVVVPVVLLGEMVEPPRPRVDQPPPPPPPPPSPSPQPAPRVPHPPAKPTPPPTSQPLAIADPESAPNAPAGVIAPTPLPPVSEPVAAAPAPPLPAAAASAPPSPPRVELPSSDADYLQNPKPSYPALSRRLGEQGKVVVRVLIGVDGTAKQAEIYQSSGYERLDQAALQTVLRWRYVPGKRGGVPEAMWFNVPIHFVLE